MKHIKLFEQFINEAKVDLVKYVKDASKKIFARGGNGQNVLDYTLELAQYIDNNKKEGDDDAFGPMSTGLFQNLVDAMGSDNIEYNNISGIKSKKKPELRKGPSSLTAEVESSIKRAQSNGGNGDVWGPAALELAGHIESYKMGANNPGPGEDGFYTSNTTSVFLRLVAEIGSENIKNNKAK